MNLSDDDAVWVCVEHMRFVPCRTCDTLGDFIASRHPDDVAKVQAYHSAESNPTIPQTLDGEPA